MDEARLEPCPLGQCRGQALLVFGARGGAYIECQNCGLRTRTVDDELSDGENAELVTALWNTRTLTPDSAASSALEGAMRSAGSGWMPGDKARYLYPETEDHFLNVEILREIEGWWEVRFIDGSTAIVRPNHLSRSLTLPSEEVT